MDDGEVVNLDRWELLVEKNAEAPADEAAGSGHVRDTLPLGVLNNYFSLGLDAQIALEFHEARGDISEEIQKPTGPLKEWLMMYSSL